MARGSEASAPAIPTATALAVLVAALGYFVDIYDLILFSVVGRKSLAGLDVAPDAIEKTFGTLLNWQMTGMLVGGLLWGILGDKRGRLSVLFGSIVLYSLANLANARVGGPVCTTSLCLDQYRVLRFVAGVGLAGELGAGVTLVSEVMSRSGRGWGTTIIAGVGVTGAIAAALVDRVADWRTAYAIGGVLGLALLALRFGVRESGMFQAVKREKDVSRGNFFMLFSTGDRLRRYVCVIMSGVPVWYLIGILVARAPSIAKDMGLADKVVPGTAVMMAYIGLAVGDLGSGVVSQVIRSRRKALALFMVLSAVGVGAYFGVAGKSLTSLYACCLLVGVGGGYWAVFVTTASEQFGTNLRSTVTTTTPNFVRGSLVPVSLAFEALVPTFGAWKAAAGVGAATLALALASLVPLRESFGRDLDFVEK